ncbi:MAG: redoxin domain protein [Fusobacteria bacterium]|nr:MAG: redoxin domain protein [Fusobacteriota bacterium]KAF0229313.1 MAG: redoxin domain [Fusobacteriota bacterium]
MNSRVKGILAVVGFVVFMLVVSIGYQFLTSNFDNEKDVDQNISGQVAKDFTVIDVDGKEVSLSDFKGKPVVINFWASWCPPCKEEMPFYNEVYKELGDEVQFMMVDLVDGSRETVATAKAFVKENGYEFPVFFDTDQEAAIAYGIYSIPTSIFIDADGKVVRSITGSMTKDDLLEEIENIR